MLIYIIHSDNIYTFRLPKDISGNYMLSDVDVSGKPRSLINISSMDGKWYFNANNEVSVFFNGTYAEQVEVLPYNYYVLSYYDKENVLLYVFPGFETNYAIKDVIPGSSLILGSDSSNCDIIYSNNSVAKKQVQLDFTNGIWKFTNLDKKTPVYINKKCVESSILANFDTLFVMGLKVTFLGGKIIITYPPNSLFFLPNKFASDSMNYIVEDNPTKEISKEFYNFYDYFFKSPIFKKKYDEYRAVITPPDAKEKGAGSNILSEIIPSALMSVTSLVSLYFTMNNYKNTTVSGTPDSLAQGKEALITSALMCLVMLITGIVWPIIEYFASKLRRFIANRVRVFNYKRYLRRKQKEFQDVINEEKNVLHFNNISLAECQEAIRTKNANLYSRNVDSDSFLKFKCGVGKVKSSIVIDYQRPDMIVQNDRLFDDIDKLLKQYKYIEDASFVFSLKNTSLAVINSKGDFSNFLNAILLQLVCLHDYGSLKLVVLTNSGSNLNVIRNLNHCWNNERTFRYFATNLHEAENISTELMRINNKFNADSNTAKAAIDTYYVIVSDCIEDYKSLKIIDYIIRASNNDEINKCMSLLMFADKVTDIPTGCNYFINYGDEECSFFNSEMDEKSITKFKPMCIDETIDFSGSIQLLSNIPIKLNNDGATSSGTLPTKLGFLEMYGVGKIEQLNILEKWKNAPVSSTLSAPVGVDSNGNLLSLDLHEKKHGPHGLVAGMTGSGKSEFIVTYILSLAINYSPDEVQFVLIDYKGGGLAGAFENRKNGIKLPHLIGTITNLDKSEMNRTLVSIKSELQRRQRVFNKAKEKLNTGSIDIYKYQMLVRDGSLDEPMSHLFIFCDEFAELKAQQPDFMDELISAARIGRSLGIHLILATQKPSGVVDEQIWSNTKFKVCCKVQTADDSNEMLRKPDAAYLKDSGRFYLQVGYDEYYVLGQSAYSGVQYIPSEIVVTNTDNTISFINNIGETYRNVSQKVTETSEKTVDLGEELNNILRYVIKIAEDNNYQYHQLWLDNVPKKLYYGNLIKKYNDIHSEVYNINPIIGEFDDPENQSQGCVLLPITCAGNTILLGNSGAGKCTFLSTAIFSTIINHSSKEVNFYVLDFGSEKFNGFKSAPQVGDVLTINDKNRIRYFFYMIESELNKRQKYYSENGGDFSLDVNNGKSTFPNIVVMIYGFEVFKDNFDELYDGLFSSITRVSSKFGIEFIITASSSNSISYNIENNFKQKVLLQLTDEGDYEYLLKGGHIPAKNPGRGLIVQDGQCVEFQTALICEEIKEKEYLDTIFAQLNSVMNYKASCVPNVPKKVSLDSYLPIVKELKSVPLGVNVLTAQQEDYDFSNKITLFSAAKTKNISKFINKFSSLITKCENNSLIILNAEKDIKLKVDEKAKYYDSDFNKIVNLLYDNLCKLNSTTSDKKFTILILGYTSLNNHLLKLKDEDEEVHTLDDMILDCDNSNFKFIIYEKTERFEALLNNEISDQLDNTNGIWIGVDYDGQSSFEMQSISYSDNPVNPSNELLLIIRDTEPFFVRFPTI